MWFGLISLFPEIFHSLTYGVTGRALKEQLITLHHINPRDFAEDKHQSVDDKPYGGGPGMVMMAPPLQSAIHAAKAAASAQGLPTPTVVYLSPQGQLFNQEAAQKFARKKSIILLAGRYEGIDQRIIEHAVDEEWSIGDYILTGGELAAMVMIDAITRLLPGTVGDPRSVSEDSLSDGLLKAPQYTRPEVFDGHPIPDVLLSGHHKQIETWRLKVALGQTWLKRSDLLAKKPLTPEENALLRAFIAEHEKSI